VTTDTKPRTREELVIDGRKAELAKRLAFAELDEGTGASWEMAVIRTAIAYAADNPSWDPLTEQWSFCTDDIRPLLPEVHPNRIGRAFALMAEEGKIVVVGMRKSHVVSSHSRRVLTYRKAE
jgi:hypothetical protein